MARATRARITDDEAFQQPINTKYLTRILAYLKPYKKNVAIAIFMMLISAGASLLFPTIIRIALDDYIIVGDYSGVPWLALAIVGASIVAALGLRYKVLFMNTAGRMALAKVREDLFDHIQTLDFKFFDSRSAGKIMVRVINDVNSLLNLFNNGVINMLTNLVKVAAIAVIMLATNWQLALISFSTLPILILVIFVLKPYIKRLWRNVRRKISNMNGYLSESLNGIKVTQAYVREDVNTSYFNETNQDIKLSWMQAIKVQSLFWPVMVIVSTAGTILIYYFGINWMQNTTGTIITVGVLYSMISYLGRFWDPLNQLSNLYTQLLVAMASLERIFEIMDTPTDIKNKNDAVVLEDVVGKVEFKNVVFGYEEGQTILDDVSFTVEPGQTVAFVGPTGAGKSTVINLLSRFYDVKSGQVLLDDHDVRDLTLKSLRGQMGIMLQDTFIFSGTIMDNIRYGRLDATDEEVMEAAKTVGAHEYISRMEKGYHTEVNERGSRLSMGQRQLLAFSRALLADPKILILDEATASIDTHTEIVIQNALDKLFEGRTSFVIAHRLSTIRKADCIMVVNDGNIVESGNHDELMELEGNYYDLCQAQYRFLDAM